MIHAGKTVPTLGLTAFSLLLSLSPAAAGGIFRHLPDETWEMEESMKFTVPDPATGKTRPMANKHTVRYKVLKAYPDGSALLEMSGAAPGQESYSLATAGGFIYSVHKADPAMQELMYEDAGDDFNVLNAADDAAEWLASEGRSPRDWVKVPSRPVKAGEEAELKESPGGERWTVKRLKDEKVQGIPCEVYEARTIRGGVPMSETAWLNRRDGFLVQRKMVQGGSAPAEVLQKRLSPKGRGHT